MDSSVHPALVSFLNARDSQSTVVGVTTVEVCGEAVSDAASFGLDVETKEI